MMGYTDKFLSLADMPKLHEDAVKLSKRIRARLLGKKHAVGVTWSSSLLHVTGAEETEEGVRFTELGTSPCDGSLTDMIDNAVTIMHRQGWDDVGLALVVPHDMLRTESRDMPAMPDKEMKEAVSWELSGMMPTDGEFVDTARVKDGVAYLYYMEKADLETIKDAAEDDDVKLIAVFADIMDDEDVHEHGMMVEGDIDYELPGDMEDTYPSSSRAAVCALTGSGTAFVRRTPEHSYGRLCAVACIVWLFLVGFFAGGTIWRIYDLDTSIEAADARLDMLSADAGRMADIRSSESDVKKREDEIERLSGSRSSWYSRLVHLGTKTEDGIWLTRVEETREGIRLKGRAVTFDAAASFLSDLEKDEAVSGHPVLKESGMSGDGIVDFDIMIPARE